MSRFAKMASLVFVAELALFFLFNVLGMRELRDSGSRPYRVEVKRVAGLLDNTPVEKIELSEFDTILGVSVFDASRRCDNDYAVEPVNGVLYRIEYSMPEDRSLFLYMNAAFIVLLVLTACLFLYIYTRIIRPFQRMGNLSSELAKGNLATPMIEEKSRYFGKFVWGLDMLRESLKEKKERELELQKEKKTLILSLSHDIRTPLSAIELYARALRTGLYDTEEKQAEALGGIEKNTQKIKSYVEEISEASRKEFLNLEVRDGEFYLSEPMAFIREHYKSRLAVLHTGFYMEQAGNCLLRGDGDRLVEVLQNVLENAVKYGDGKRISVTFGEEEDCKLIRVENTGASVGQEEIPHLFDSFYRGSNSENVKGSGLGLYICKSLMKKMDGDIYVKAGGSVFCATVVVRKA